jgi:hypothetical protein
MLLAWKMGVNFSHLSLDIHNLPVLYKFLRNCILPSFSPSLPPGSVEAGPAAASPVGPPPVLNQFNETGFLVQISFA